MCSYKNFRCAIHNKFFELNLYQKNPTITHHWRSNLARPSRDIDLSLQKEEEEPSKHIRKSETEQEGNQDPPSSENNGNTVFLNLKSSLVSALEVTKHR
ncbi:hypothetical protein ACJ72_04430 [Emergomyces africanus]|uniref:Uncharacterized protein n=1 Tax=Emergomyces africanus TaxID=1955775 RepID=A0A1B7NWR8_9EURO|nr:hypothetical protein ACJ72_04430 [Emergomyces africanus]